MLTFSPPGTVERNGRLYGAGHLPAQPYATLAACISKPETRTDLQTGSVTQEQTPLADTQTAQPQTQEPLLLRAMRLVLKMQPVAVPQAPVPVVEVVTELVVL